MILVLSIDLILEILFERGILLRDFLKLQLKALHFTLLFIQCVLELTELLDLHLSGFLHLMIDKSLAFHELIVLSFEVLKPVLKSLDISELPFLSSSWRTAMARLVLYYRFEEVVELF